MRTAFCLASIAAYSAAIKTAPAVVDDSSIFDNLSQEQVIEWGTEIFNDGADLLAQVDPVIFDNAYDTLAQVGEIGMNLYNQLDEKDTEKIFNGLSQVGTAGLNWMTNVNEDSKEQVSDMLAQAISTTGFTPEYAMEFAQNFANDFDIEGVIDSLFSQTNTEVEDDEYTY
jgi:hypothetical protein